MASSIHSPEYFALPNRMCWLCRRESEILRYNHSRSPQSALFREITLQQKAAGGESTASISAVVIEPRHALPRTVNKRTRPLPIPEQTNLPLNTADCPVYNRATRTWTFRVHADCWDLVACRVTDPIACATAWCKSLISANWGFNHPLTSSKPGPQLPKELRGTATPWGKNHRRVSMQQLASFDGLAAELGLAQLPTIHQPLSPSELGLYTSHSSPLLTWPTKATDPLCALPAEILQQIIEHTSTPDLLSLRLASRAVACVSQPSILPRSFWRSRFAPPFEMGFALPERVDGEEVLDWRGMYFLTRRALLRHCVFFPRAGDGPLLARLAKRRYWWDRLRRVVETQGALEGVEG